MNNKKTGREIMALAELLGLIPDEQEWSRKTHRSILIALNKVLCNNLLRVQKLPTIMIFNDAKFCYDRIMILVAPLALCRISASREVPIEMMVTLQGASHKVYTTCGDSYRV